MGTINLIIEIEHNVARLIGLPHMLQSTSKSDRKTANKTLHEIVIPKLCNIEGNDNPCLLDNGCSDLRE